MLVFVGSDSKNEANQASEPPYARYAFLNPYNLSLLTGAGAVAAATGQYWIAIAAAASEALWMLFAPGSTLLQKTIWDKRWDQVRKDEQDAVLNQKFARLSPQEQARALALREQRGRIQQLAAENPSLAAELMSAELVKLDALMEDFLDLALVCQRCERQLAAVDVIALQRSWQFYEDQTKHFAPTDQRREVAEKNLEVIAQRRNRIDAMQRNLQTARGHMDLMENSFRLLADEIVTMADPSQLASRLDDLRIGVEAIREGSEDASESIEDGSAADRSLRA
jgi:hypothetical protein